ncbi:MAG: hypothetical protein KC441_00615 [Anaerolineales bacterium]|nr:hypothetical protein [Anaerolineales bacterium]
MREITPGQCPLRLAGDSMWAKKPAPRQCLYNAFAGELAKTPDWYNNMGQIDKNMDDAFTVPFRLDSLIP